MTGGMIVAQLARAVLPIAMLFIGKLIIDDVVLLSRRPSPFSGLSAWLDDGAMARLGLLLAADCCRGLGWRRRSRCCQTMGCYDEGSRWLSRACCKQFSCMVRFLV